MSEKMNEKEIIQALPFLAKCCKDEYNDIRVDEVLHGASNIINRQQELIEALKAEIERLNGCVKSEGEIRAIMKAQMEPMIKEATNEMFDRAVKVARADAVIDFAESLKKLSGYSVMVDGDREIPGTRHYSISEISLDKLVKEKLEDAE